MAYNIIDTLKGLFHGELLQKASKSIGESEQGIQKAWSALIPAVMSAIVNKVNTPGGPQEVYSLAAKHTQNGQFSSDRFFASDLLQHEGDVINNLFGTHQSKLNSIVSDYSALSSPSVHKLTTIASSASLGLLAEQSNTNKWSAQELATYLNNQKPAIMNSLPGGLDLSPVFGQVVEVREPVIDHGRGTTADPTIDKYHKPVMKTSYWLTPTILLAVIAIVCLYNWSNAFNNHVTPLTTGDTMHRATRNESFSTKNELHPKTDETSAQGSVDSAGNFIYNTGTSSTLNLPGGNAPIQAGSGSTEAKLLAFLNNGDAKIDSTKGNWFEFTGVTFNTGSADLTPASEVQLKNFVSIAKAYPDSKFKIGGYTDNAGDATINKKISQQRAQAVYNKLLQLGLSSGQLTGAEGYGPEHPIGDNNTAEGKAMNRRVAVNVKAK